MFDIFCVTAKALCEDDFLQRMAKIAKAGSAGIILREKELEQGQYKALAGQVMEICAENGVTCVLHSFTGAAIELGADCIHMPMHLLRSMTDQEKAYFKIIGASCHSAAEAQEAQSLGCGYITAGHVFETDCKRGLEPRGLNFLRSVCDAVSIPVYAIGGIGADNIELVWETGAAGACIMSGFMKCAEPERYMTEIKRRCGC